jgi:hypothetical protein
VISLIERERFPNPWILVNCDFSKQQSVWGVFVYRLRGNKMLRGIGCLFMCTQLLTFISLLKKGFGPVAIT